MNIDDNNFILFKTETDCVYCAVRTESVYIIQVNGGLCLDVLRRTAGLLDCHRKCFRINSRSVHVRFIVVIVSLEEVPVREFRVASVGVVPQMLHTHLSGCVTRTRGRRLGASQKAISEIREYLIEKNYQSMKREDQQDATIICLLLTSVSKCFGHHYAHLQENKGPAS